MTCWKNSFPYGPVNIRAEDAEKSGIPRSLYSLIYGLEGAFHGISQFGKLGGQDVSPYHSGAHAQQILRENAGDGERILMDLAYSGGNMLPIHWCIGVDRRPC